MTDGHNSGIPYTEPTVGPLTGPLLNLEDVFKHPAGLSTARHLVGEIVKSAVDVARRAGKEDHSFAGRECSGNQSLGYRSSFDEPGALEQLLLFKSFSELAARNNNMLKMSGEGRDEQQDSAAPAGRRPLDDHNNHLHYTAFRPINSSWNANYSSHTTSSGSTSLSSHMQQPSADFLPSHIRRPDRSLTSVYHHDAGHTPGALSFSQTQIPSSSEHTSASLQHFSSSTGKNTHTGGTKRSHLPSSDSHVSSRSKPTSHNTTIDAFGAAGSYLPTREAELKSCSPHHQTIHSVGAAVPGASKQHPASIDQPLSTLVVKGPQSLQPQPSNSLRLSPQPVFLISDKENTPTPSIESFVDTMTGCKRKLVVDEVVVAMKKQKLETGKTKKVSRPKPVKDTAGSKLSEDIWMRILEFTPPRFLAKVRLVDKLRKDLVDRYDSIYVNCRKENFGHDMPPPPDGITERQYSNLLEGKGCQIPDCEYDTEKMAARTHWSWSKRWCMAHWKEKIVREDRLFKIHSSSTAYPRPVLTKLLECIPVGMQDSFVKPHDFVEDVVPRARGAPRLYKVYLQEDVDAIMAAYDALTPAPYQEDPNQSAEEKATALAAHQAEMDALEEKRNAFFAERKAKVDAHMAKVIKIEHGIRARRGVIRKPHAENRNSRRALFTLRASQDLPHIPEEFVIKAKAFKAATRVFRDPGSERGWLMLKPKIETEWQVAQAAGDQGLDQDKSLQEDSGVESDIDSAHGAYSRSVTPGQPVFNPTAPVMTNFAPHGRPVQGLHRHDSLPTFYQRYGPENHHNLGMLAAHNQNRLAAPMNRHSLNMQYGSNQHFHSSLSMGMSSASSSQTASSLMKRSSSGEGSFGNNQMHSMQYQPAPAPPRPSSTGANGFSGLGNNQMQNMQYQPIAGIASASSGGNRPGGQPPQHQWTNPYQQFHNKPQTQTQSNRGLPISHLLGPQTPSHQPPHAFLDFSRSFHQG